MLSTLRNHKVLVILALALLLALLVLLTQSPPNEWSQAQRLGLRLQNASVFELLAFIIIGISATAVGLPRQLFAFISGFAFGVVPGVALSLTMAIIGCGIAFTFSRRFLRGWIKRRYQSLVNKLDALTVHDAFWKVVMLRFQPLGTNLLTNVAAGVSQINPRLFLLASFVGYVPQMLVFALIGSGIRVGSRSQLLISVVLLLISFFIGLWLLSRSAARQASQS